jgi:hypothetical protein
VFVISDGFDNARQGDVSVVVGGLAAVHVETPIYHVLPLFKSSEDISNRRFGEQVPVIAISNEAEAGELIARSQLAGMTDSISDPQLDSFCRLALQP